MVCRPCAARGHNSRTLVQQAPCSLVHTAGLATCRPCGKLLSALWVSGSWFMQLASARGGVTETLCKTEALQRVLCNAVWCALIGLFHLDGSLSRGACLLTWFVQLNQVVAARPHGFWLGVSNIGICVMWEQISAMKIGQGWLLPVSPPFFGRRAFLLW